MITFDPPKKIKRLGDTGELNYLAGLFPDEIRMMMATLKMSNLGGLNVAECENLELQNRLFEYFRRRLEDEKIYLYRFEVDEKHLNLVNSLSELTDQARFKNLELTGKYKSIVIFVHGLEQLNEADSIRFLQLLNFLRDRFTRIAQPVVIWAKPSFVTRMARHAPDFWSWKGTLFNFPSDSFEIATVKDTQLGKAPPIQRYLQALKQDPDYSVWADLYLPLKAVPVLETAYAPATRHTFTEQELTQLINIFPHVQEMAANQTVFKKGDIGAACYVLLEGAVEVSIPNMLGEDIVINRLKHGDFFGEIALIKSVPRTATIKTTANCKFLTFSKAELRPVAAKISKLLALMGDIADRRFEDITRVSQNTYDATSISSLYRFDRPKSLAPSAPADVLEILDKEAKVVLLGDPGAGKTTVLRAIVLKLAEAAQQDLRLGKTSFRIPIYIKLSALTPGKSIEDLILSEFQGYGLTQLETEEDVRQLLQGHRSDIAPEVRFTFIMDSLNEMKGEETDATLSQFIQAYSRHQFILACRLQDYVSIKNFKTIRLQTLTHLDIEVFLSNYLGLERGKKVAREIYSDRQLIDLAQTPLALYMFAQITRQGADSLPKNRGVLFEKFTDNLLERIDSEWWKLFGRSRSKTPLPLRKAILAELGLAMQQERVFTYPKKRWLQLIAQQIALYKKIDTERTFKRINYSTLEDIHEEIKFSGLIRYNSNSEQTKIEFAHQTYQEFFAALALRRQARPLGEYLTTPDVLKHWHSTIIFLYGISNDRILLFSQILGETNNYARIWLAAQSLALSGEEIAVATGKFEAQLPAEQKFAMLFSVGLALYQVGRYPEALTYLLKAADLQPGNAEVQYELGSLYRQLNQYKRAIRHLEESIRLRPDFVDAYNQLGITYYDQQQYEEALTIFTATTQLEPGNAHHYYNLGTVQKILQDYQAARDTFQTALKLKPDYTEARAQLDVLEKAFSSRVVQVLKSIPMLAKLTLEQSIMLADRLKVADYRAGDIVFHMGEMGNTFYIIESGQVQVLAPEIEGLLSRPASHILNNLEAGDFFGEIALLRAVPRTATIRCAANVRLLELSREDFDLIVKDYPSIAHNLAETSGYRLLQDRQSGRTSVTEKYYDPTYLQELLRQQDEVTVLMGDIHGSTFLTDAVGPELMIAFLDEYLLRMSDIVVNAGGAMDKSLGDSVMGVFGGFPERSGESATSPALRALFAGMQMREAYLELREEWKAKSPLFMKTGMGIGISIGPVSIGTVGAEGAMVGAAVNLSNKLSKMAIRGRDESEIYIDQKTRDVLGDAVNVELLDPAYVIGKAGGVQFNAYRVI